MNQSDSDSSIARKRGRILQSIRTKIWARSNLLFELGDLEHLQIDLPLAARARAQQTDQDLADRFHQAPYPRKKAAGQWPDRENLHLPHGLIEDLHEIHRRGRQVIRRDTKLGIWSFGCSQASGVSCVWTGCRGGGGSPDPRDRRALTMDGGLLYHEDGAPPCRAAGARVGEGAEEVVGGAAARWAKRASLGDGRWVVATNQEEEPHV
jgi:hypothetical protein